MEFVAKNDTIDINDPSINLTTDNITNKLFYFSEISGNDVSINLYLDKSQLTENLNFDCLFPSDSKIENIYVTNNEYPLYINEGIATGDISYTKQSFSIIIDNSNLNIFSHIKRFEKKVN
tara:strand:- start:152 stop:511 length:360 start_codon:yes stop_codon:yes gene_type:complete